MHMVEPLDDAELLARYAQARDEVAFAELVRRYLGLVYHAARRQVGDTHRAEEVTQEVFTRLARKAPGLTAHTSLAGWLHATTRHAALESLRAERRRRTREREAFLMNEAMFGGRDPEWERIRPALDEALGELAADDREIVLWRYFLGLSWRDIGARLGAAENTARMRGDRALERLQGRLAKRGLTSTAAIFAAGLTAEALAAVPGGLARQIAIGAMTNVGTAALVGSGGLVAFMSATKMGWVAAGLLVLAGLVSVGWQQGEAAQLANARAAELQALTARLAAETREMEAKVSAGEAEIAQRAAQKTAALGSEAEKPAGQAWDPLTEGSALMARHPGLADAVVARSDAINAYRYGRWLKQLNLTPNQQQRFFELLRVKNGISAPFGPRGEMFLFMADAHGSQPATAKELGELLGARAAEMDQIQREASARTQLSHFAKRLLFSETPLTEAQAQQMLAAMIGSPQATESGAPKGFDWAAIAAKMEGNLTEAQRATWVALRKREATQ